MKKLIALALTLLMLASLVACGDVQTAEGNDEMNTRDLWRDDDGAEINPETLISDDGTVTYKLRTKSYSHWYINDEGKYDYLAENKIKTGDDWYYYNVEFSSKDTAFIVMDPWCDCPDDYLNEYFGEITEEKILPLMKTAAESCHRVFILTNDPSKIKYNTKITPGLQELVDAGKAELLYHSDWSKEKFIEMLDADGINKLIYTGFASNMCILTRTLGISNMLGSGKRLFFVPECSAAMEHADTWDTQEVHKATTFIIGQVQAKLIDFEDIYNAIKK